MELTYKIMLYGGTVSALITLAIAIWLFVKLDIVSVLEDLFGLRMRKQTRDQHNANLQIWGQVENTSSSIRLKKLNSTHENKQAVAASQSENQDYDETELLEEDDDQTELLEQTTILEDETELLVEENNERFVIEDDIVIVHEGLNQKEESN